jgi:NAD(P)-dependent dehydrogenase (short-subunit alcohol dehydrogenase family)
MKPTPQTVLVTGASAGIGRATVELLAQRGYRVLAGTRAPQDAAHLLPPGVEPVHLDVTRPDDVTAVVEHIRATCPQGLFALVNNAGVAPPAPVELVELDEVRLLMEVNVIGPLRLIQACLPLLRQAPRARIVNMSSMNGSIAMPMIGAYSASKFALEALSDVLRVELRPWGITVSVIRPGQVRTPIFAKALAALAERSRQIPTELLPGYSKLFARARKFSERGANTGLNADAVARTVLKALRARWPKPRYKVGFDARGLDLLQQTSAVRVFDRILARAMGTMRLQPCDEPEGEALNPRQPATSRLRPGTLRNS